MASSRRVLVAVAALVLGVGVPSAIAAAPQLPGGSGPVVHCTPGSSCLPTNAECQTGAAQPLTVSDDATRVAVCVSASGHTVVYVGGKPQGPCGEVVVADDDVAPGEPNSCPYPGLPGATWQSATITADDGTPLHADVFRPNGVTSATRTPILLIDTPYGNAAGTGAPYVAGADANPIGQQGSASDAATLSAITPALFRHGFTVVVVTFRGFGESGGCDDFGGAKAQADVARSVRWAASQPWSDGHVGMWGMSADGWATMMALATDPPGLDAVVVQSPPIDRYAQAYDHGVPYAVTPAANAARYAFIGAIPPSLRTPPDEFGSYAARSVQSPTCDMANVAGSLSGDPTTDYWTARDLTARAARSRVPVLLSQGFLDDNVKPATFLSVWSQLRGPHRAWFGQYEHVQADTGYANGRVGRDGFAAEALRWLGAYVARDGHARAQVERDPAVEVESSDGTWWAERQWPPSAQPATLSLTPGSYTDVAGNSAGDADPASYCANGSVDGANPCLRTTTGVGALTIGPQLTQPLRVAGAATVCVQLSTTQPNATLIGLVYDVTPDGGATLIARGASLVASSGPSSTQLTLYPQDYRVPAGHHIDVLLTGADDGWYAPHWTGSTVTISSGVLTLPVAADTGTPLPGAPSAAGQAPTRTQLP